MEHHARIKSIALQALRWGKVESLPHAQNDKTVSYGAMNWLRVQSSIARPLNLSHHSKVNCANVAIKPTSTPRPLPVIVTEQASCNEHSGMWQCTPCGVQCDHSALLAECTCHTQARAYEKSIDFSRRPGVSIGASRRSLVRGVTATSHMLEAESERLRSDEPTAGDGDPFCWARLVGNSDISGRAALGTQG